MRQGVLVLGLGCENSNIEELKKYIGAVDEDRVKFLVAQEVEDEIEHLLPASDSSVIMPLPSREKKFPAKSLSSE